MAYGEFLDFFRCCFRKFSGDGDGDARAEIDVLTLLTSVVRSAHQLCHEALDEAELVAGLTIETAGVHNYATTLWLRFLIGVFEAGFVNSTFSLSADVTPEPCCCGGTEKCSTMLIIASSSPASSISLQYDTAARARCPHRVRRRLLQIWQTRLAAPSLMA